MSDTPKADALQDSFATVADWFEFARNLERENAALREALQNCAYAASGQKWQQIAWIVEGALYDPRRRRSRERDA